MKRFFVVQLLLLNIFIYSQKTKNIDSEYDLNAISLSPLSLFTLKADPDDISFDDYWMSITLNFAKNNTEYDFGVSKYPNYFSLSVEKRNFRNSKYFGFKIDFVNK